MPSNSPLKVALLGVSGRMGKALLAAIDEADDLQLSGGLVSEHSRWGGKDLGALRGGAPTGVLISSCAADAVAGADVAIDFTLPGATRANLDACVAARVPLVIGTTGHDAAVLEAIRRAAETLPIVHAANMSLGVNVLLKLVEMTAKILDASYDIEIFEAHHRHKRDAPSGTALALGRAAAKGRGASLEELAEYARHGDTGARRPGSIGFSVVRGGDIVGEHVVSFVTLGERIELTHRAHDRMGFARGALVAARWLARRGAGLYDMQDVLGLARA
jgi:4-hydroxy-tetrahydrodipicolinate reductase